MSGLAEGKAWGDMWKRLASLDDEEWDVEDDRLEALWKDEYRTAFLAFAGDCGWQEDDARDWCDEYIDDALGAYRGEEKSPQELAQIDVREAEREAANCGEIGE